MSVHIKMDQPNNGEINHNSSLSHKLGFAAFSCFAFEGLKSSVSYLAPHVATAATHLVETAAAVSAAAAESVPFALCAGVAGGAIGTALITSPTFRETVITGLSMGKETLSGVANKAHSAVSAIGSGIADGVNFIGNNCPSLLGTAAICYGTYLAYKQSSCFPS